MSTLSTASWTSWRASATRSRSVRSSAAEFIRVFEEEARKLDGIEFLGQGTIYPDIIESGTKTVKAVKSHHNVGGLPEDLQFALVEPLKMLFKDEVRACGKALGLPDSMVYRQPFPGPGLGVRCLGAITRDRLEALREADAIMREEFANAGLAGQGLAVLHHRARFQIRRRAGQCPDLCLAGHPPRGEHRRRHDGDHRGDPLRHPA